MKQKTTISHNIEKMSTIFLPSVSLSFSVCISSEPRRKNRHDNGFWLFERTCFIHWPQNVRDIMIRRVLPQFPSQHPWLGPLPSLNIFPFLLIWLQIYLYHCFPSPFFFVSESWPNLILFSLHSSFCEILKYVLIPWFGYFYNLPTFLLTLDFLTHPSCCYSLFKSVQKGTSPHVSNISTNIWNSFDSFLACLPFTVPLTCLQVKNFPYSLPFS